MGQEPLLKHSWPLLWSQSGCSLQTNTPTEIKLSLSKGLSSSCGLGTPWSAEGVRKRRFYLPGPCCSTRSCPSAATPQCSLLQLQGANVTQYCTLDNYTDSVQNGFYHEDGCFAPLPQLPVSSLRHCNTYIKLTLLVFSFIKPIVIKYFEYKNLEQIILIAANSIFNNFYTLST